MSRSPEVQALARKVREHIVNDPSHWDQSNWFQPEDIEGYKIPEYEFTGYTMTELVDCDSHFCAAGWTVALGSPEAVYDCGYNVELPNGTCKQIEFIAQDMLGLDFRERNELFGSHASDEFVLAALDHIAEDRPGSILDMGLDPS